MAQRSQQLPHGKHKPGPKSLLSTLPEEVRFAVRYSYLTDPEATMAKLADKFSLPSYTISQLLNGPEYESVRTTIQSTQRDLARDRLHAMTEQATAAWLASLTPASKRGDHRPAKDLLLATKVIDPDQREPHVTIQIGIQSGTPLVVLLPQSGSQAPAKPGTDYIAADAAIDVPASVQTSPQPLQTVPPALPPAVHVPQPGTED